MKVALIFPYYNDRNARPRDALAAYPIVRCLPPRIAALGHHVRVFLQSPANTTLVHEGVPYEFVAASGVARGMARVAYRWRGNLGPAYYEPIVAMVRALAEFRPDVVHFFGLTMDIQLAQIVWHCQRRTIPQVVHFHGGMPASGRRRLIQRYTLGRVDRALFTTRAQADTWLSAGLLSDERQVELVLETSSPFERIPRTEAQEQTQMHGDPVCLSAGRLHPIKDPLTMLRGFASFARHRPAARLYLYYLTDEMIGELRAYVASVPGLSAMVEFRGRAPAPDMAAIYSSADVLLQASTREWSGLAVLEAMSCGCIPVVTDIPSFRKMTDDGQFGRLFSVGDAEQLTTALRDLFSDTPIQLADEVEAHFHSALSFDALARQMDEIYHAVQQFRDNR